jgi:hypothetical protein
MTLQNRVAPDGEIHASPARGLLMGNRGGRFHDPQTRMLTPARWRSRAWICCRTAFRGRHRQVMGEGYTELFFLDEVTALAAGHRPCFECRRAEARAFQASWQESRRESGRESGGGAGLGDALPRAAEMDERLDRERREGKAKRTHAMAAASLPDGALFRAGAEILTRRDGQLLAWEFTGYREARTPPPGGTVEVLTPPALVGVLAAGYRPLWHPSAGGIGREARTGEEPGGEAPTDQRHPR